MLKSLFVLASLSLANVALCAPTQLLPSPGGAEVNFVAEAQKVAPNDLATFVLSAHAESRNIKEAQEKVNSLMNKAVKELKDYSSTSKISNLNYTVRPLYRDSSAVRSSVSGWEATQRIQLATTELENVPALVQLAQSQGLALTSINYSLTNETQSKIDEQLIEEVVKNLNKKASDIATAMNVPLSSYSVEKIDFDESFRPIGPMLLAARAAPANMEGSELPVFEPGTTEVQKSARVTLKITTEKK